MPKFSISTETIDNNVRVIIREQSTKNIVFSFWATEENARQFEYVAAEVRLRHIDPNKIPVCSCSESCFTSRPELLAYG